MQQSQELRKNEIKNFLILQLYKEYDHILYSYKISLKKAFIKIDRIKSYYGSWFAKTRTITLSEDLIEKYPWEIILEILKHEMAHQYVEEIFKEDEGHGVYFKKACDFLRVKPWARKAHISLESCLFELSKENLTLPQNKSLRLVKKLLSLSGSSNENEALEALKKASSIAKKNQIDLEDLKEEKNFTKLTINLKRRKIYTYETLMASLLVSHFNVKVIHSNLFDKKSLREEKILEVLGDVRAVKMSEYVFWFLKRKLEALWEEKRREGGSKSLRIKHSFFFGVLDGFRSRLEAFEKPEKASFRKEKMLLLRRQEKELANYVTYEFPRTTNTKSKLYTAGSHEYSEGFSKGKKIKLREPLDRKSPLKRLCSS